MTKIPGLAQTHRSFKVSVTPYKAQPASLKISPPEEKKFWSEKTAARLLPKVLSKKFKTNSKRNFRDQTRRKFCTDTLQRILESI